MKIHYHLAWSGAFLKTFENMRKLDFSRLLAPAAVLAHLGASSLKKSNFLIFSKVLRKGADQAKCHTADWYMLRTIGPRIQMR